MKYDLETFFLQLTIYLMTSLTRKQKQTQKQKQKHKHKNKNTNTNTKNEYTDLTKKLLID